MDQAQAALEVKLRENAELESYAPKLKDMERQLANLKQQLEIERRIVPDEKEVDGFIKMMDAEALKAGIEIRRYTAKPVSTREFYTEVPFEIELDGPYYSVLNFFDRVGKLEATSAAPRACGRHSSAASTPRWWGRATRTARSTPSAPQRSRQARCGRGRPARAVSAMPRRYGTARTCSWPA